MKIVSDQDIVAADLGSHRDARGRHRYRCRILLRLDGHHFVLVWTSPANGISIYRANANGAYRTRDLEAVGLSLNDALTLFTESLHSPQWAITVSVSTLLAKIQPIHNKQRRQVRRLSTRLILVH